MNELFNEIIEFNNIHFPNWRNADNIYYSNALAGECGELCNMTKHNVNGGTKTVKHDKLELLEECADIFIYLALFVLKNKVSSLEFRDIIKKKMIDNYQRMDNKKG